MSRPLVAIVGRPNVGKSMLFNKLCGRRLSIVEDTPGVTRDRLYAECEWCGRTFDIVDTGGIEPSTDNEIRLFMREQAQLAIDAADVVLVNSHLSDVPAAIRLSRATLRNIHENLFWAFFYNTIGIPIAAGVFVPLGLTLNPMIGAAAMSLSSFCVVTNALRLNLFKLRDTRHDHKRANHLKQVPEIKEETAMKKTIQIEGMMCAHCEATVKKALEALPEVTEAEVSHTAGTAVVTLSAPVDDAVLKSTVEAKDYKVTGIA